MLYQLSYSRMKAPTRKRGLFISKTLGLPRLFLGSPVILALVLEHLSDLTRTNGAATFTDSETQTLVLEPFHPCQKRKNYVQEFYS